VAAERPLIVSIVGTRPEAIKMLPVVRAISARPRLRQQVLLTGQHQGLAPSFAAEAPLRELAYDPRGRTPAKLRETLHRALCGVFRGEPADLVLVHGDTTSALAGAFAAHDCGIPIGHVEAGLRSFDYRHPWPEEGNRIAVDAMSDILFAPTPAAAANLAADHHASGDVFVTGNTGIDALFLAAASLPPSPPPPAWALPTILVTCHRKENAGPSRAVIASALERIVRELPVRILLPLHPNRHIRAELEGLLAGKPRIELLPPLGYTEMVALIARSWLIVTDSGGLQEEGPALGKPVLVLRDVTERPEAAPNVELVGADPERIFASVAALLADPERHARMSRPNGAFGDGRAGPRIAELCEAFLRARRSGLRARA
jgi:UDP-N-acetylglucosamine 2-epimerase (non-hydrolysing)